MFGPRTPPRPLCRRGDRGRRDAAGEGVIQERIEKYFSETPWVKRIDLSPHFSPVGWGLPEGRGFSPAEIVGPTLCSSRAPRSPDASGGSSPR